jgi:hypothetical protein
MLSLAHPPERSENILRRLSGRSGEEARDASRCARGHIKVAMLLLRGSTLIRPARYWSRSADGCAWR